MHDCPYSRRAPWRVKYNGTVVPSLWPAVKAGHFFVASINKACISTYDFCGGGGVSSLTKLPPPPYIWVVIGMYAKNITPIQILSAEVEDIAFNVRKQEALHQDMRIWHQDIDLLLDKIMRQDRALHRMQKQIDSLEGSITSYHRIMAALVGKLCK